MATKKQPIKKSSKGAAKKKLSAESIPRIQVTVLVIARGNRILAVHNEAWGSFTLPMTKQRHTVKEEPKEAAIRVAAECLGTVFRSGESLPKLLDTQRVFHMSYYTGALSFSERDGTLKHYEYTVFGLSVNEDVKLSPKVVAVWLTPDEFETCKPISPSATKIIAQMKVTKDLPPWKN